MDDTTKMKVHLELSNLRTAKAPPLNLLNYNDFIYLLLWQMSNEE